MAAALVVVAGAILGVAGFAVEQSHANWRPHTVRTASGWRVTEPGAGIGDPAVAGDHLTWQDGPYTLVMDMGTGHTRLVGDGVSASSVASPTVSSDGVVWEEAAGRAGRRATVYAFDFASGRRLVLGQADTAPTTPAVSGPDVYWLSGASGDEVVGCRLTGGSAGVIARQTGIGQFLMADGTVVAWSGQGRAGAPFTLTVHDVASGATADLRLPGQTPGAVFEPPILAGEILAWLRADATDSAATIATYDLTDLAERQIVQGRGLVGPGFDGETVVWAQPSGSGDAVMAQRLDTGAPVTVAHTPAGVQSVVVSGDTVAWWVRTASHSWIETARLPS